MERPEINPNRKYARPVIDLMVTLILWSYYTVGFVFFFAPFYVTAFFFSKDIERSFQRLNHKFYKGFFALVRTLISGARWCVDDRIMEIRSAVIVCNHISYLDSILLISLFAQHRTIVKSRFFKIPIFRQVIEFSGYIPSDANDRFSDLILQRIEEMDSFLESGGNLFIFPEGTRSRDGRVGKFNKGAFKIARLCNRPIKVLHVHNTDRLFKPGKFLFDSCFNGDITVTLLDSINPDYQDKQFSISKLMRQVRSLYESQQVTLLS